MRTGKGKRRWESRKTEKGKSWKRRKQRRQCNLRVRTVKSEEGMRENRRQLKINKDGEMGKRNKKKQETVENKDGEKGKRNERE